MNPLVVEQMTVAYDRQLVLENVSFSVPEGKLVGIIGPNGAGKSTLMKAMLNFIPRMHGHVFVYGQPYEKRRHLVGYVPQRNSVDWDFPTNALDVVLMGRYGHIGLWKRPKKKT